MPALVVVAALVIRRAALLGALPPGLDGAQWLAIGRGLLGESGRSTAGAYAPLVPLATAALAEAVGPIDAVRLVALGSYALAVAAVGLVATAALGSVPGASLALAAGSAGTVNEPLAFGGYPQQVALAGLVAAGWGAARCCSGGGRIDSALVAIGLMLAALAHHLYFLLAVAVVAAVWALSLAARRGDAQRTALRLAPGMAIATLVALPTVVAFARRGYAAPLDAVGLSVAEAWRYATRESPLLWLSVVVLGTVGALLALRHTQDPAALLAAALLVVGGTAFGLTAEPRLLPLPLLGGLFGVVALAATPQIGVRAFGRVALPAFALLLVVPGDRVVREYLDFYRVLDPSLAGAAAEVERLGLPVAVRADRRGWPVGWWLEGLTTERVAVGSDPRWLAFPGERAVADDVAALFDGSLPPAALRARADRLGVELLLLRKWEWIGWERWLAATDPAVEVVHDDGETLLLRLRPSAGATGAAGGATL